MKESDNGWKSAEFELEDFTDYETTFSASRFVDRRSDGRFLPHKIVAKAEKLLNEESKQRNPKPSFLKP